MSKTTTVKIENNAPKLRIEWKKKREAICYAMGLKWQELCTKVMGIKIYSRNPPWKLTGRLRASLTFYTNERQGKIKRGVKASKSGDTISGNADKRSVIVGTNVPYAAKVNNKHKYMEESLLNYRDSYKRVASKIMKE